MRDISLTSEELLLAERIAMYYRQPEHTSYFDKEFYFNIIRDKPKLHYVALDINRQLWSGRRKKRR